MTRERLTFSEIKIGDHFIAEISFNDNYIYKKISNTTYKVMSTLEGKSNKYTENVYPGGRLSGVEVHPVHSDRIIIRI